MSKQIYKNCRVSIISGDEIETYKVLDIVGDVMEYEKGILTVSEGKKFYDITSGGLHFIYNLDIPAKVESHNLKLLRRSEALKNIFKYDKENKFDFMGLIPYIIIVLMILFG